MGKDFVTWLNNELNKRGWSNSELHRRSGMATSTISMVLGGQKKPGWEFCLAIATALNEPPEKIFRIAGLLPALPSSEDETLRESIDILKSLSPQQRKEVLRYLRFLHQGGKEE